MIQMNSKFVFICSTKDIASINMANCLIEKFGFNELSSSFEKKPIFQKDNLKLIITKKELLYIKEPKLEPKAYIFLSRHKSESRIPTLTAHFPGNFSSEAKYGGMPCEIGYSYPTLHKKYLLSLSELQDKVPEYNIVTEPTHHGPTSFSRPVLFIEIGSSEKEWTDQNAVFYVCKAIINSLNLKDTNVNNSIGFGGTHYSEKFTKLIVNSDYSLGSIIPKYSINYLNENIVNQMIEKSIEKISYAIIDWKGVKDREKIISLINKRNLEILRI